ncbi:MAG: ATP-binding cassette domain-containing protein [Candidatus Synoicihabitans palmerolidicus]|nr:ATP-binding cassette domain-containing protein [Candidatus Synoicihabitans palmerolidicus]
MGLAPAQFQRRAVELSGGQQQCVGIARAFFLNAEIVLADEPVASLDPRTSRDVMTVLRDAAGDRDTTVLCSLHQIDRARAIRRPHRGHASREGRVGFAVRCAAGPPPH